MLASITQCLIWEVRCSIHLFQGIVWEFIPQVLQTSFSCASMNRNWCCFVCVCETLSTRYSWTVEAALWCWIQLCPLCWARGAEQLVTDSAGEVTATQYCRLCYISGKYLCCSCEDEFPFLSHEVRTSIQHRRIIRKRLKMMFVFRNALFGVKINNEA